MIEPWKETGRKKVIDDRWLEIDLVSYETPNGLQVTRWWKGGGDGTRICAITEDGRFVVNHEFRQGPSKVIPQLAGGYIDPGEDPFQAARRELREETGYEAGSIELLAPIWEEGASSVRLHYFLARDCKKAGEQQPGSADEIIEIELLEPADFIRLVESGDMLDTTCALLALRKLGL